MLPRRLTDAQFIARVRWWHRTRRWWGTALLVIGLCMALNAIIWGQRLARQSMDITNSIAQVEAPTDGNMSALADNARFFQGLVLGFVIGKGLLAGGLLALMGLGIVVGPDRRNRMLLDCCDSRQNGS